MPGQPEFDCQLEVTGNNTIDDPRAPPLHKHYIHWSQDSSGAPAHQLGQDASILAPPLVTPVAACRRSLRDGLQSAPHSPRRLCPKHDAPLIAKNLSHHMGLHSCVGDAALASAGWGERRCPQHSQALQAFFTDVARESTACRHALRGDGEPHPRSQQAAWTRQRTHPRFAAFSETTQSTKSTMPLLALCMCPASAAVHVSPWPSSPDRRPVAPGWVGLGWSAWEPRNSPPQMINGTAVMGWLDSAGQQHVSLGLAARRAACQVWSCCKLLREIWVSTRDRGCRGFGACQPFRQRSCSTHRQAACTVPCWLQRGRRAGDPASAHGRGQPNRHWQHAGICLDTGPTCSSAACRRAGSSEAC